MIASKPAYKLSVHYGIYEKRGTVRSRARASYILGIHRVGTWPHIDRKSNFLKNRIFSMKIMNFFEKFSKKSALFSRKIPKIVEKFEKF
jgi:hypothetical protein